MITLRYFIIILGLLLFRFPFLNAQTIYVSGEVEGIWEADTIKAISDLLVPEGRQLIIQPGTYIEFQGPCQMVVEGTLRAQANEAHPITFTIIDTLELSNPCTPRGGWKGLHFGSGAREDSSIFEYCRFLYGKAWEGNAAASGGLIHHTGSSPVRFSDCLFAGSIAEYMGGAVYLNNAHAQFIRCVMENNRAGFDSTGYGGAVLAMGGSLIVKQCTVRNNRANGLGGGFCIWYADSCAIVQSIFQENTGSTGGALFFLNSDPTHFENNLLTHNTGYFFGGAIGLKNTGFLLLNNTIADNNAGQGGGIYCSSGVHNAVMNTLICGNTAEGNGQQVYIAYLESTLSFYHCVVESGREGFGGSGGWFPGAYHGEYLQNHETPVTFVQAQDIPYGIAPPSPAIDGGYADTVYAALPPTDLLNNKRISGENIDIGAIEYQSANTILPYVPHKHLTASPNPFLHTTYIALPPFFDGSSLLITNLQGAIVRKMLINNQQTEVIWDGKSENGNDVPPGLYFVIIAHEICTVIKQP